MKPKGLRHNTIPVPLGGQFSAGDLSTLPEGTVSLLRNFMIRPNRFDGRAPFVYDSLDDVYGFAIWQDLVNELQKTVAMKSGDNKLYTKNANGTGYTAGVSGLTASARLTGWTNFLGKLYMAFDNGAGVPTSMAVWDGTNLITDASETSAMPFNSKIQARALASIGDRNFLIDPRVTVTNLLTTTTAYDWVSSTNRININAVNLTNAAGVIECRLTPTSLSVGNCYAFGPTITEPANSLDLTYTWRCDLKGVSATYAVPYTLEIATDGGGRSNLTAVVKGDLLVIDASDGKVYLYRCTTAGTTAAAPPIFTPTVGATTADGTVEWTNIQFGNSIASPVEMAILSSVEGFVPTSSSANGITTVYLTATLPARTNSVVVRLMLKFSNTVSPAVTTLAPVIVSIKDGKADSDPTKKNYGQQLTRGDFYYPFFNKESAVTASINLDAVIYSEISNAKSILARNTYPLTEIAGLGTAGIVSNGRLVVFKRSGMWIFKGTADPYEPILPESPAIQVGCLGPRALDTSRDNVLYWIGENHVYKMAVGTDAFPTAIDSPGMFEEIMARGSDWVESQATYNLPLLAIDHANNDVWIYTQKGHIHVYSIQSGLWSYIDTNPTGSAAEVRAMIFDPVSNRMLVSFGGAAATRFDETSNAQDTIVTGGGTAWDIRNEIVPKPFELFAARYEASLLEVGLFHLATIQNGELSIRYSYDRGVTYTTPDGYPVTSWLGNPRIRLPLAATGESVTIKFSRTGAGGRRNFSVSKADALLRVHRGELTRTNAT